MRTVKAPVPHQTKSHSSQRPAGVVGGRNLGGEQKGHRSDILPPVYCFSFQRILGDVLEDAFVWLCLIAVVRRFFH